MPPDPIAAEKRRAALKRVMDDHGVNPTELAVRAGFPTPNAIYNFLKGRSKQLSTATYQAICKALPGVSLDDLTGDATEKISPSAILKTVCRAGDFRESFSLESGQISEIALPIEYSARKAGAYAALVRHPGAEIIYPAGTLLLIVPIERANISITKGHRLLVERFLGKRIEVTVREVQSDPDGDLWLSHRSNDPRYSTAIKLPPSVSGRPWKDKGEKFAIAGIVIGAYISEDVERDISLTPQKRRHRTISENGTNTAIERPF